MKDLSNRALRDQHLSLDNHQFNKMIPSFSLSIPTTRLGGWVYPLRPDTPTDRQTDRGVREQEREKERCQDPLQTQPKFIKGLLDA